MAGFPFSETTLAAERRTQHTHPWGRNGEFLQEYKTNGWVRSGQMEDAF